MKLNVDAELPWMSSNAAFPIFAEKPSDEENESRVFCSTGKGGGKDATCSPKDKGGGGDIPDVSDLTKVKSLGGSTGATLAADKDGTQYVVKGGNSPDHLRSEFAANQIYAAAGISVPRTKLDDSDPKRPRQISEYVDAKPLASVRGEARDRAIAEIQKGFAADALLANWDVVGLEQDNILVPKSGAPLRVDNGGSLTYRAQGKDKPFGPTVSELESLRTSAQGKPIFGSLKDEQVASQIDDLSARRDKILAATPAPLRETMGQRLDYMEKWAAGKRGTKRGSAIESESRVFCATGKGGGKDASCSPKDSGGGGGPAADAFSDPDDIPGSGGGGGIPAGGKDFDKDGNLVSKVVSKSSMEVGKSYKVTKLGKDYHGKVVSVEHSEDGKKTKVTLALEGGGKKSLVLMSAAKVQEKQLGALANAEKGKESAWKTDVQKLVSEHDSQKAAPKATLPAGTVTNKSGLPIPSLSDAKDLPSGPPDGFKTEPTPTQKQAATSTEAQIYRSPTAVGAVKAYTASAFAKMNRTLRDGVGSEKTPLTITQAIKAFKDPTDAAKMVALSVATETATHSKPITVYRGSGETLARIVASLPPGGEFIDRGFGSTSLSPKVAQNFEQDDDPAVICKITTRWGLPVEGKTSVSGELEYIQPRNMRYREKSRTWRRVGKRRVIYAEFEAIGPSQPHDWTWGGS
jgi:hypothetical protein